ncbi:hypothetical protein TIFTF001_024171 [Ficus carica]|uniref:Uncharacterized protein n=1 Tax=Ficus carica TaxID=3494 RepID=A0AA88AMW4_FICCA|nr:hypothetical protein TIFTF001_024171 [Ficus carica]
MHGQISPDHLAECKGLREGLGLAQNLGSFGGCSGVGRLKYVVQGVCGGDSLGEDTKIVFCWKT